MSVFQQSDAAVPPPPVPPAPPLPVPPPPPPLFQSSSKKSEGAGGSVLDQVYSSIQKESHNAFFLFHSSNIRHTGEDSFTFIAGYQPVVPVIQNGPLCGMVALAMASDMIGRERILTEDILKEARARGYSQQGEMFSAKSMASLAAHFLQCPVELMSFNGSDGISKWKSSVVSDIMMQKCVLIPYDEDKDHGPCLRKGHKAHWALLTGFFFAVPSSKVPSWAKNLCRSDPEIPSILYWPKNLPDISEEDIMSLLNEADDLLYVFGHQGKSKYAGKWPLSNLMQSNLNLVEADPKRLTDEYTFPAGGLREGLQGQVIVLSTCR